MSTPTLDPTTIDARNAVRDILRLVQGPVIRDYPGFLRSRVAGREVLDVGSVEHTANRARSEEWEFWVLHGSASRVVGIDVLADDVAALKSEYGLDFRVADATVDDGDLGDRFDVVVAGDVIEHTTKIESFLDYCVRHLHANGCALVKTPNPFFYPQVFDDWRRTPHIPNVDHTCWISPPTLLQLVKRLQSVELTRYWPHVPRSLGRAKEAAKRSMIRSRIAVGALAPDYIYELRRRG